MKTSAGLVEFVLPEGWRDSTSYIFRSRDEEVEVTLAYSPMGPDATPEDILDPIERKLKATGLGTDIVRGVRNAAGLPCSTLVTRAKSPSDVDETVMHVVTFIPRKGTGATLTGTSTADHEAALKSGVSKILESMSLATRP